MEPLTTSPSMAAVIKAVETGEITEERLNESVLRILKMKIKLSIIADTADAQD